jgi:uncharacterized protein (TIGR02646 family)
MRYIKKDIHHSGAAALLDSWKKERKRANQNLLYDEFDNKEKLNEILREEQGGICCYCQQKIIHYHGNNNGGSHNEHLIPQNGEHGREDIQTEYTNLYACCNYSKGREERNQHCGEAKRDKIIANFIQRKNCNKYFKYNSLGEIIPQGPFKTLLEFEENQSSLTADQRDALKAIKTLNLNQTGLVEERKKDQTMLFKILNQLTKQQIAAKIQLFNTQKPYIRFIDMYLILYESKEIVITWYLSR